MDEIDKIHETQEKARKNKEHQGNGNPQKKLPNNQHGTNK